jgi:hypothetical protein
MLVIDIMHNLFLGTAKRMISLWLDHDLISRSMFDRIQKKVDEFVLPPGVGRIPSKILNGFSGFKADQFKNWVNIYSIPVLFGILNSEHFECWRHFVLASRIVCKHQLTEHDMNLADALFVQFCKVVERMYGDAFTLSFKRCLTRLWSISRSMAVSF